LIERKPYSIRTVLTQVDRQVSLQNVKQLAGPRHFCLGTREVQVERHGLTLEADAKAVNGLILVSVANTSSIHSRSATSPFSFVTTIVSLLTSGRKPL